MSSMLRDVAGEVNVDALRSEIRAALITRKANACPIATRLAWHASGTFDKNDSKCPGGSFGGSMRFAPESDDPDNAGLSIVRDLLLPIKEKFPMLSHADIWVAASCCAIEFLGGPQVPFAFGRIDGTASMCPANGRLPDALQGAEHLRKVFGERMGFSDRDIVALSGGHTLGRCHKVRSGFDGPWTRKPLKFDNDYFRNLLNLEWVERKWDGPRQFEDKQTGDLMMLPTDLCLIEDPAFRQYVEIYAKDEKTFFADFAQAYAKLVSLGCPPQCDPSTPKSLKKSATDQASAEFREHAMHGSVIPCQKLLDGGKVDIHQLESTSGRSALHKAAYWGHVDMVRFLTTGAAKQRVDVQDYSGETALHDAARFGHLEVVKLLVQAGTNPALKNVDGQTAAAVARQHGYDAIANIIEGGHSKL